MLHSFHRFANASKSIHCTPCGNTGASHAGATLCGLCDAGQYMLNQVCTDCAQGYASVYGQANCTECKQGKFANRPRRATVCSTCDAGTYNNQTQQTDGKVCLDCPSGRYSSATGVGDVDLCKLCTFDSLFTLFGRENGTHTLATRICFSGNKCQPGKVSDTPGNKAGCSACPAGQLAVKEGSTQCTKSGDDTIVLGGGAAEVPVPPGSYLTGCTNKGDDASCTGFQQCPAGWVGTDAGLVQNCSICDKGTSSFAGTTACRTCSKGRYRCVGICVQVVCLFM